MNDLAQIALGLLGGIGPPVAKARRTAVSTALIVVFAVTAYIALAAALWLSLVPVIGPAYAALVLAGIAIVAALVVWAVTVILDARAKARAEAQRSAALQAALSDTALQTLPKLVSDHPMAAMAVAAGLVFALTPRGDG
ncbi:hypothetical protein CKO11_09820 [Rhodobacter sp. TJ_12]|uniref:hypothetical protein n=1 Tax=Rhodobacter sp. TJ_12 TaxID=2029399 RepID=UPI001CBD2111|nr:hypothetical protein [Rhodobacter sp. TJ_12]MBZ4022755.1 hypothetical protein [Rhodobacter sp. TJ_12]